MNATVACAQVTSSLGSPNSRELHPPAAPADCRPGAIPRADRLLRSVTLAGPVGRLEAILNLGAPDARYAAVVCHPHPLYGGNLHSKIVYHAMKTLNDPVWGLGWPVLRFSFRGAGLSQGKHDGEAETGDVQAALDWLEREFNLPLVIAGFSFGAAMALRACSGSEGATHDLRALIALGLPISADGRAYSYQFLHNARIPKLFVSGDHDEFAPVAQLAQTFGAAAEPKRLVFIPGADHFFTGQLEPMQHALADWLKEQLP